MNDATKKPSPAETTNDSAALRKDEKVRIRTGITAGDAASGLATGKRQYRPF